MKVNKFNLVLFNTCCFLFFQKSHCTNLLIKEHDIDHSYRYVKTIFPHHMDPDCNFFTHPVQPTKPCPQNTADFNIKIDRSIKEENILISEDRRERIICTQKWPNSFHSHLTINFPDDSANYGGSGVFIGPNHILTAAHNVLRGKNKWAKKIIVTPGLDETTAPFGKHLAIRVYTFDNYQIDKNNDNPDYDMALIIIAESVGKRTGWSGIFGGPDSAIINLSNICVTGYPGEEKKYQLWTMEDKAIKKITSEKIVHMIDTSGGQSGSSIGTKKPYGYYTIGIHTHGDKTTNAGSRISKNKFDRLIDCISSTSKVELRAKSESTNENLDTKKQSGNQKPTSNLSPAKTIPERYQYQQQITNHTDLNWDKGISKLFNGFLLECNSDNQKKYQVGKSLLFSDGVARKILKVDHKKEFNTLEVHVNGSRLSANKVGYPKEIQFN